MCLGVEAIDYGIDVACFWEEVGSKGNKRGGVEAIHNKCASKAWQKLRQMWSTTAAI